MVTIVIEAIDIMIVEDETIVALEIEERLKEFGYNIVASISSGEKAVKSVEKLHPSLVLMDIRLGGSIDGIEAAQLISARFSVPVLFLTAFSDDETLEQAREAKPYGYLLKPFKEQDLHASIQMALFRHEFDQIILTKEQNFRLFFENAPVYCYMVSLDGKILDVNKIALSSLGYAKEDLIDSQITMLYAPEFHTHIENKIIDLRKNSLNIDEESILITTKGSKLNVQESLSVVEIPSSTESFILLIQEDITERKQVENRLLKSEEKYRQLFHSTKDAILIRSMEGVMLDVNQSAIELFGFSREELLSMKLTKLADKGCIKQIVEKLNEKGWSSIEATLKKKNGEKFIGSIFSKIVQLGNQKTVQTTVSDITERKQSEERIERTRERVEFFLDLMSHDLSNIHQAVYGIFDLLLINKDISQEGHEYINEGIHQMIRCTRLIHNVQKIKKIEDEPRPLSSCDIFGGLSSALQRIRVDEPSKELKIRIESEFESIYVMADDYLIDVFYEILHNAMRFNPESQVDVDITISIDEDKSKVIVQISDYGQGISDDTKDCIFKRASLRKTGYLGSGIGLTLVNEIMEYYGGSIEVYDRVPGDYKKGATFVIKFVKAPQ